MISKMVLTELLNFYYNRKGRRHFVFESQLGRKTIEMLGEHCAALEGEARGGESCDQHQA